LYWAQGGNAATLVNHVYATPPGWTAAQYSDGIVLTSPGSATGERCLLACGLCVRQGPICQSDANYLFQDIFKTYELRNRTSGGNRLALGVFAALQGRAGITMMVKRGIGKPSRPPGMYESLLVS